MGNTVSRLFGAKDSKSSKGNTTNGQQTTAAAQSTTAMTAATTTTKSSSPSTSVVNPIGQDVIDSVEKHGYLFGLKLAKSLSPLLHSTIYRGIGFDYGNYRLESDDISLFLELVKHPKFYGASVTMPNKVAILPHLDELTPECRDVGACNTVYFRTEPSTGARLLCGTNTDTVGVRESFLRNVPSPDATFYDRPALVVGGGGAARSAVYALRKWLRVRDIYLVNRDDGEVQAVLDECASRGYGEGLRHVKTVAEAQALEGVGAVVACVPDFPPVTDAEKTARAIVETFLGKEHKGAMLEMCYNPTPYTEIWALGEKNGWQVILGTEAMIWQGFEQHRYWDDIEVEKLPIKEVQEVIANALAKPPSSKL